MKKTGLSVLPFQGVLFDFKRVPLSRAICPPYDVIDETLGRRLRKNKANTVHIELPLGEGSVKYAKARETWRKWRAGGVLRKDAAPAFYAVEQSFQFRGKAFVRTGIMASLGLDPATAARVLRHERTLSKPKKDRTRLLRALKVNTSPIFAIYPDAGSRVRRILAAVRKRRPLAAGRDAQGTGYRLWRIDDPKTTARVSAAFASRTLLIADGHHRYEVAREHWRKTRRAGADGTLAFLVAEEDPGLIVNPTHRVLDGSKSVRAALARECRPLRFRGLEALERAVAAARTPYAFGLCDGLYELMLPAADDRGVPSGFGIDWVHRKILASVDPQEIAYHHESAGAMADARKRKGLAVLIKPFEVRDIRTAVEKAGLLPQKSTYFYPKIAAGLVFRESA